jgi:membrane associated rhomboid family serine protease
MFVPLKDDNPLRMIRMQYACFAIIGLNVLAFLLTGPARGDEALMVTLTGFGVVPTELLDGVAASDFNPVAEPVTLFTYMFLHAGWLHLLGNMAFLWVFADNVEDQLGHFGFVLFYLACGIAAAMAHVAMLPASNQPLVGASGAMSGVLAAYLILFPKARVWILLFMRIPLKIPAWLVLGGWIVLQFVMLFSESPEAMDVAWWAHIGGFAMGLVYILVLRLIMPASKTQDAS